MNLFKSLVVLALSATCTFAGSKSLTVTGAGTNSFLGTPCLISQILAINAGTQSVVLTFLDASSTNVTYTNGTYTNYVMTVSAKTNVYTSYLGTTVSNVYNVVSNIATTVAAATNSYPVLISLIVPTNSAVTYSPPFAIPANRGMLLTNKDTVTVSVFYQPAW